MSGQREVVKPRTPWNSQERRFFLLGVIFDHQRAQGARFERCEEIQASGSVRQFLIKRVKLRPEDEVTKWGKDLNILSQLRHRNILGYEDAWQLGDVQHVLCENARMCLSVCLGKMAKEGQTGPCPELYPRWLFHIISALEYIHEKNDEDQPLLHRAVQPDNILLTDHCVLKLCAFHTAKRLEAKRAKTVTVIGGGLFQSPESRKRKSYDQSVDVWGFGVTAVYIADYLRADKAASAEKLLRILKESGQDEVTYTVVNSALMEDPQHRDSASQIAQILKNHYGVTWLQSPPQHLFPAPLVRQLKRVSRLSKNPPAQSSTSMESESTPGPQSTPERPTNTRKPKSPLKGPRSTPEGSIRTTGPKDTATQRSAPERSTIPSSRQRQVSSAHDVAVEAEVYATSVPALTVLPSVITQIGAETVERVDTQTQTSFYTGKLKDSVDMQTASTQTSDKGSRPHTKTGRVEGGRKASSGSRHSGDAQGSSRRRPNHERSSTSSGDPRGLGISSSRTSATSTTTHFSSSLASSSPEDSLEGSSFQTGSTNEIRSATEIPEIDYTHSSPDSTIPARTHTPEDDLGPEVLEKIGVLIRNRPVTTNRGTVPRRASQSAQPDDLDTGQDRGHDERGQRSRGQGDRGHRGECVGAEDCSVPSAFFQNLQGAGQNAASREARDAQDPRSNRGGDLSDSSHHRHRQGSASRRRQVRVMRYMHEHVETDGTSGLGDSFHSEDLM